MALRATRDLTAGLTLAVLAIAFLWLGAELPAGTARRMGPGWVPRALAIGLLALAIVIVIGDRLRTADAPTTTRWTPLPLVAASLFAFALLIERAGLVAAAFVALLLAGLAGDDRRPIELVVAAAILALATGGLFVGLLALPVPLWPVLR
jgi:hypothetical protein